MTLDGEGIRSNNRHFLKEADARTAAEWLQALRGLEDRGFIEPLSDERSFFRVTGKGYEAADQLEGFARWSVGSIVLKAHYYNRTSDECVISCKGVIAIPATYLTGRRCRGQIIRSLKERRSLLVEGVSPRPPITWEPTDAEFVDTVTSRVEQFRVERMQFIQPSLLKLPIVG